MEDRFRFRGFLKAEKMIGRVVRIDWEPRTICIVIGDKHYTVGFGEVDLIQRTGMKDKNGVLIYEGDKLSNGDDGQIYIRGSVVWHKDGFALECSSGILFNPQGGRWEDYSIVGNIYEDEEITTATADNCSGDNCKIMDYLKMLNHNVLIITNHLTGSLKYTDTDCKHNSKLGCMRGLTPGHPRAIKEHEEELRKERLQKGSECDGCEWKE